MHLINLWSEAKGQISHPSTIGFKVAIQVHTRLNRYAQINQLLAKFIFKDVRLPKIITFSKYIEDLSQSIELDKKVEYGKGVHFLTHL